MNKPPSVIKTRFAIRFIRALKRVNKSRGGGGGAWSMRERYMRYRAVRAAACASMASAVGPERVWSRAVLRKIRLRHLHVNKSRKRGRFGRRNPRENLGFRQEDDLRGLVPGGRGMGICSLLSETAHYINCLQAQVQVMTDILNHLSNSS